ncbi:MAG: DUF1634 domain-containing protein [Bryobacteraceae bacterium]
MTDKRLEIVVANLLRAGVLLSAAVVLTGGICYLGNHGREIADYRVFHPSAYRDLSSVFRSATALDCGAMIELGLILLIATPIARVAFSLVAFAMQRDRTYVIVTAIVLAILLFSIAGQHAP